MAKTKKAAPAPAKSAGTKKPIADIAHPGTTAPSDTSKPIINQRPMIKDPMMVEGDTKPEEAEPQKPLAKKSSEVKVTPPAEPADDEISDEAAAETADAEEQPAASKTDDKADDKPDDKAADTADADADETETEDKDAAGDDKDDKKPGKPDSPDAETAEEAAKEAKLQQLVDSKKYFLPINAVEQRRSKQVVVIGTVLALVLVVAWADIALDAGLIHLDGVKPLTHFFSN